MATELGEPFAEQDPGLVSLWATGVVNHFAELGITIHTPTVYRVLDMMSVDMPAAQSRSE